MKARWFSLLFASLILVSCTGLIWGTSDPSQNIKNAICAFYKLVRDILPIVAMLMIFAAGVVYAAGQILGAETRARANVWAHAMFIGAIIGLLLSQVLPWLLNIMYTPPAGGSDLSNVC